MSSDNSENKRLPPSFLNEGLGTVLPSLFFILLGCLFLFAAGKLMDETHPSFVFLLAILGVSIVLYGTGTQGVGQADLGTVPVKVFIAGGAGVLAAVFGFGVVWQGKAIKEVFSKTVNYGVAELTTNLLFDLRTLKISASTRDGTTLPIIVKQGLVEIYVPISPTASHTRVCVTISNVDDKSMTSIDPCVDVPLSISNDNDYGAQVTHIGRGTLPLVPPQTTAIAPQ